MVERTATWLAVYGASVAAQVAEDNRRANNVEIYAPGEYRMRKIAERAVKIADEAEFAFNGLVPLNLERGNAK